MSTNISFENISISPCERYHLYHQKPLYSNRFEKVMKFHKPGLAPVKDIAGAYHIFVDGKPAYAERFLSTFGFYEGIAAVKDEKGWFHILPCASALYETRYAWCGNFQNNACVVKDNQNNYFHIDKNGMRLYPENYRYAGDFRDGIAMVQNKQGLYSHINHAGKQLHGYWFLDLDVYHKGYARAKDNKGWFHIDNTGNALYAERYAMVEPFYNGLARVETVYGELLRINENGEITEQLRSASITPFQKLSGEMVGYWKTQVIKAAVDLEIFEHLPATLASLSQNINVNEENIERLLRALAELNLVKSEDGHYKLTELSEYLVKTHSQSLYHAAKHWASAHYLAWMHLAEAIKQNKPMYEKMFNNSLFEWLDQDHARLLEYQQAMTSYAKHDYFELVKMMELSSCKRILDAGGGEGTLIKYILSQYPHLQGILLERESVANTIQIPADLQQKLTVKAFDLFKPWPETADAIVLSRVLHDWNDQECTTILNQAVNCLSQNGYLFIIEMLIQTDNSNGGMLDMNMLVIAGGKERTLEQYQALANQVNLNFMEVKTSGSYSILKFKRLA